MNNCDCGSKKIGSPGHAYWCISLKPSKPNVKWEEFEQRARYYNHPGYNMAYATNDLDKILSLCSQLPGVFIKQAEFIIEDIDVFNLKYSEIWIEKDAPNSDKLFDLAVKTQDRTCKIHLF